MVITERDYKHPIIRVPFNAESDSINIELWSESVAVPPENSLKKTMSCTLARFHEYPLEIHFYKVMKDVDEEIYDKKLERLAFKRHIQSSTSACQDMAAFSIIDSKISGQVPGFIDKLEYVEEGLEPIKQLDEVKLKNYERSLYWLTQRDFYNTTLVTSSNPVHRENLDYIITKFLVKYKNKKFASFVEMIEEFGHTMQIGRIRYKCDEKFAKTGVPSDAGDALVELTTKGDCEDFGHFYMRVLRTLANVYKFILDPMSDLYLKCQTLAKQYVAFNFICGVRLTTKFDFHSTLLLVPRTAADPVVSFEVTDTSRTYSLPSEDFDSWHKEHYFLLCPTQIHRLNRRSAPVSVPIEKLTVRDLFCYNY